MLKMLAWHVWSAVLSAIANSPQRAFYPAYIILGAGFLAGVEGSALASFCASKAPSLVQPVSDGTRWLRFSTQRHAEGLLDACRGLMLNGVFKRVLSHANS